MAAAPVQLARGRERTHENDALASAAGGRVELSGVLADLNRTAVPADARGSAARWAFSWDREDERSARWWPQGITSSADASPSEVYDGRSVLVTTSYSKVVGGLDKGCRISVVDLTDPGRVRYRHVLLVVAVPEDDGRVGLRPVHAHAGGAVWHGSFLHVAATAKGFYTFSLDDIVPVGGTDRPTLLGALASGGLAGFGHRYVLPVRFVHAARTEEGVEPFRYSFLSLSRPAEDAPALVAGEYGRGTMTTRLLAYPLDPATGLPASDESEVARPAFFHDGGVPRMQGAVSVAGRLHVTTSDGRRGKGSIWVGEAGRLQEFPKVLPPGPEDLCYWPSRDQLWTVTEYPGRRRVLALDRDRFG